MHHETSGQYNDPFIKMKGLGVCGELQSDVAVVDLGNALTSHGRRQGQAPSSFLPKLAHLEEVYTILFIPQSHFTSPTTIMASRRGIQIAAGAVAAVGGYYLYSAGGSPRVAEKQFERKPCRTCTVRFFANSHKR